MLVKVLKEEKLGPKEEESIEEAYFRKNNTELPTVRISKIVIDGFKSVEHGEVVLDCGKQFVPHGTRSDILGIYGQNGSGKTSLIEALAILKRTMSGSTIPSGCTDCISVKRGFATLTFTFDLQYQSGEIRTVEYRFSIKKNRMSKEELKERWEKTHNSEGKSFDDSAYDDEEMQYKICVFDESVKLSIDNNGRKTRFQTIVDTSSKCMPFGPNKKLQELIGADKEAKITLRIYRENLSNESKSFIFNDKVLETIVGCGLLPVYYETLMELRYYATEYLFVIDTESSGIIGLKFALPLHTRFGNFLNPTYQNRISIKKYDLLSKTFMSISKVLSELVPGLSIELKKVSDTIMKDGKPGYMAIPVAYRNGTEIPLRDESDGVQKIISVLNLIITAYNDESVTIAIDEFDAGIFEYLLGEILQSFEESGKGQFIFTSHNLRPLEVIDKKFLVFTTTNENNRYYRFKDLSSTNNLRDKYFREIVLGGQEEVLYNKTKRFKIESAMRKAYEE